MIEVQQTDAFADWLGALGDREARIKIFGAHCPLGAWQPRRRAASWRRRQRVAYSFWPRLSNLFRAARTSCRHSAWRRIEEDPTKGGENACRAFGGVAMAIHLTRSMRPTISGMRTRWRPILPMRRERDPPSSTHSRGLPCAGFDSFARDDYGNVGTLSCSRISATPLSEAKARRSMPKLSTDQSAEMRLWAQVELQLSEPIRRGAGERRPRFSGVGAEADQGVLNSPSEAKLLVPCSKCPSQ